MKLLFFIALSCIVSLVEAQNEVFEGRELGTVHFRFENFIKAKHGKYTAQIEIQSNDVFSRYSTNLSALILEGNTWLTQIPLGSYNITIRLRSNYSLVIRKVEVTDEKSPTILVNMQDVESRFRKTNITREFRDSGS